jgi:hypothetical protein
MTTMTDLTIHPFEVHVPEEDLADLQRRIAATRWPKYESEQLRSEHAKAAALADPPSALEGKLSSGLDVQVLVPHPAGNAQKGAL